MRCRLVAAKRARYPVRLLCRVIGVAASGLHAWRRRGPSPREQQDHTLAGQIAAVLAASRRTCGSPRAHAELARPRHSGQPQARGPPDARGRAGGDHPPAVPAHHRQRPRPAGGAQPARAEAHRRAARHGLAGRHLLHSHRRRLAAPGRDQRPGDPGDRRLVDVGQPRGRRGLRGPADGDPAAAAVAGLDPPFGPRRATCLWRASEAPGPPWPTLLDEPARQRLRQLADGELLRQPEERARPPHHL